MNTAIVEKKKLCGSCLPWNTQTWRARASRSGASFRFSQPKLVLRIIWRYLGKLSRHIRARFCSFIESIVNSSGSVIVKRWVRQVICRSIDEFHISMSPAVMVFKWNVQMGRGETFKENYSNLYQSFLKDTKLLGNEQEEKYHNLNK